MSALNTGDKPCSPDGNGCLCPVCVRWRTEEDVPIECHKGACIDCDPDRTEPDTLEDYGPTKECPHFVPAPAEKLWALRKAIAIDFDGCLCSDAFPEVGAPNWEIINKAKHEQRWHGAGLILWTCREGQLLQDALNACKQWGLSFDAVNESLPEWIEIFGTKPRKVGASEYWDDKAEQMGGSVHPDERLTITELRTRTDPVWCSCATIEGTDGFWCLCDKGIITAPSGQSFEAGEIPGWELYPRRPMIGKGA